MLLDATIERLVKALDDAGHPMASSSSRSSGRDPEETQAIAMKLFGFEMPTELLEMWAWWGSSEYPPKRWLSLLGAQSLPGSFQIENVEYAKQALDSFRDAGLLDLYEQDQGRRWVPVVHSLDSHSFGWVDVDEVSDGGRTPLYVTCDYDPPATAEKRFDSVSDFFDELSAMIENGYWVLHPESAPVPGWDRSDEWPSHLRWLR